MCGGRFNKGRRKKNHENLKSENSEIILGDMTLEDFLIQAGIYAEASPSPIMGLDAIDTMALAEKNFSQKMGLLSSSPSLGTLSDTTTPKRRRDPSDTLEKTMERRLKRKIKNRESAARSRARKQVIIWETFPPKDYLFLIFLLSVNLYS